MKKNKIITRKDLQRIAQLAHNYFMEMAPKDLEYPEFIAKCYLEACNNYLKLDKLEYEERTPYSPADE